MYVYSLSRFSSVSVGRLFTYTLRVGGEVKYSHNMLAQMIFTLLATLSTYLVTAPDAEAPGSDEDDLDSASASARNSSQDAALPP